MSVAERDAVAVNTTGVEIASRGGVHRRRTKYSILKRR
jgi:hypothetical protein